MATGRHAEGCVYGIVPCLQSSGFLITGRTPVARTMCCLAGGLTVWVGLVRSNMS